MQLRKEMEKGPGKGLLPQFPSPPFVSASLAVLRALFVEAGTMPGRALHEPCCWSDSVIAFICLTPLPQDVV